LGDLPGGSFSSAAYGISADGKVIVGRGASTNGNEAFRWTAATGMVGLGDLPGGTFSSLAFAVSADGSVVVGDSSSSNGLQAFRWTEATGMVGLGDLPGADFYSSASGVSADGSVIVGGSRSGFSGTSREAFRWTASEGMVGLGDLPGGNFNSIAYGVSADGNVIVGNSSSSNATSGAAEAFRWTQGTGMVPLGDFPDGYFNSIAYGISADGLVIVGRGFSGVGFSGVEDPFRWTAEFGLLHLGFLPCDTWSTAFAASANGAVIVGDPNQNNGDCAFIWDAQHGIRSLHTVLVEDYGLNLTGWQLVGARGISADANTIVGYGINPAGMTEAWIANLKPPSLAISRAANHVVLWWETNASGFVLEQTSSLSASIGWSAVTEPVFVLGDQYVVTNSVTQSPGFFRLRKP
jgi:probable HAF family extracellular repeat protein